MTPGIAVNECEVGEAKEGLELIAYLSVCCGIVIGDYNGNTMLGHTMRPEGSVNGYHIRYFGEYITPRSSIDEMLRRLGDKGIEVQTLGAYLFGCNGSSIADDLAREARCVLREHNIPIRLDKTQQSERNPGIRLSVTPKKITVEFLESLNIDNRQAEIHLIEAPSKS